MQYRSPVNILSYFLNETDDLIDLNINKLRKRILAEFELKDKPTIKTNVGELSKNEILNIIDDYKSSEDFEYHLIISRFPLLLDFLENNIPIEGMAFDHPCFKEQKFIIFLSPFLANSIGIYFATCIRHQNNPINLGNQIFKLILPESQNLLIQPVFDAVDEIISEVESINPKYQNTERLIEIISHFKKDNIEILNLLPVDYYIGAIDLYAQSGINLILFLLKNKPKKFNYVITATFIVNQLIQLNASSVVKIKINSINKYIIDFKVQYDREYSRKALKQGIIGFFLFFLLMRILAGLLSMF